jgi:hypothetical protein
MAGERRELILAALRAALVRQTGAAPLADPADDRFLALNGRIDLPALADAVLAALGEAAPAASNAPPGKSAEGVYVTADEGMTPDKLDASNDE